MKNLLLKKIVIEFLTTTLILQIIVQSKYIFARKFDEKIDEKIIDRLYEHIENNTEGEK